MILFSAPEMLLMKSKNEKPAIICFLQLYKEEIVYIFLDSNAAALKAFLKFVIPHKISSAIFTEPSAMSSCHAWQTRKTSCVSHKSKLIYSEDGTSSNCLPELARLSLISGSSSFSIKGVKNLGLQVTSHLSSHLPYQCVSAS